MPERPGAIDLFCGAGGLSTGLEWAGFDVIWATDSDPAIEETYGANHSIEPAIEDIRNLNPGDIPVDTDEISLVAGGPPCPTFSRIGKSKINSLGGTTAAEDDRHYLFEDFLRFVEAIQPPAFLMENVVNMETSSGDERESIIQEIRRQSSAAGYRVAVYRLDAADYGVPQHRKRIFIIGNRLDAQGPDLESRATHRAPFRDTETDTAILREPSAFQPSPQVTLDDFDEETGQEGPQKTDSEHEPWITVGEAILDLPPVSPGGDSPPATASSYTLPPITSYQRWARNRENIEDWSAVPLTNHTGRGHNPHDLTIYKLLGEGVGWTIGDVSQELQPYRDDIFSDNYRKLHPRKPAPTILAHLEKDGHMFIHPSEARSITVREAARLQSFPDTFEFRESLVNNFRLVGNAVPPLLSVVIGEAILSELLDYVGPI